MRAVRKTCLGRGQRSHVGDCALNYLAGDEREFRWGLKRHALIRRHHLSVNVSTKGVIDGSRNCRRYFPTGHWLSSNVTACEPIQATGIQSQKLQNLGIPILPRVLELESLDDCPPELPEQPPSNPPQP